MGRCNVSVVGLGYIGLPTAALIASRGMDVTGVDTSVHVVETINRGEIHIEEANLAALVAKVVQNGSLRASTEMAPADVFIIAVPTPVTDGTQPDTTYVLNAAQAIASQLQPGNLVILESTCPVGTTEKICAEIGALRPDLVMPQTGTTGDVRIAYCPERVLPGKILSELVTNDRSLGGISPACAGASAEFYRKFVDGTCFQTTARVAEMTKLVENSFRDVNIAFANELSLICETLGTDVWQVIELANRHPRVNILQPGPGVGGHCIAVDPWFIVASDPVNSRLISTARSVNLIKTDHVVASLTALMRDNPAAEAAFLGLAFKPDIDDLRESPAVDIVARLAPEFGSRMMVVEPFTKDLPPPLNQHGVRQEGLDEALVRAGIVVLLVDHSQFKSVPRSQIANKIIYDTRGVWR